MFQTFRKNQFESDDEDHKNPANLDLLSCFLEYLVSPEKEDP